MKGAADMLAAAFARYGAEAVIVRRDGSREAVRAFIQPLLRETVAEPFEADVLGAADTQAWRYLGAAETPLRRGERVEWDGRSFVARSAEAIRVGDEVTHYEAMLQEEAVQ